MRTATFLVLASLLAGCAGNDVSATTSTPRNTTSTSSVLGSTLPPVVECPGVGEFGEGRSIAEIDGTGSDTRSLGRISWETSDQCENFHFVFETSEGAPATSVPDIRIDHLESFQVVRINMDIDSAVITDQLVETNLVERLFVVRSLSGGMFVDLHLAEPAAVRASSSSSPARLEVELRPGFVPFSGESAIEDRVVLTSPTSGSEVGASTQFLGYSRTFEANVLAIATQDGAVVAETTATAADYLETWGEYRLQLGLPSGPVSVFIGETSPEDGSLDGITIDLSVS
ncbi:MAG TPA: Gmad2 immunoglobulin-like domain-containing protein [Acidimicrobiia bacterium]|nr:Gmad2 immunoglobulin-like domain-containing protein [Acidimicrobiia bacterium]